MSPPKESRPAVNGAAKSERLPGELDTAQYTSSAHPDCAGCCACMPPPPPVDAPLPEPVADWLLPDTGDLFRPRDYFIVQVVRGRIAVSDREHARAQLEAAWAFQQVHGRAALIEALTVAAGMAEGLDGPLVALLAELTGETAA